MTIKAIGRTVRRTAACGVLWLAAACASLPAARTVACGSVAAPPVALAADGRVHARLDVMTYNIEGLGWPARNGRAEQLEQIGRQLAALRQAGDAPDVVVFQEMFSHAAIRAVGDAGYPAEVAGPSQFEHRDLPADGRVPGPRSWRKGELGFHLTSGGLAVISRYPIVAHAAEPFSRRACAGLDCLSNKGALLAEVEIPGVPDPVQVFDSHMNSRHASRAPLARSLFSHHVEAHELADFMAARGDPALPTVLAGDFNMRHSQARYAVFEQTEPLTVVQRYCRDASDGCEVKTASRDDTPWMDTEDLQLFHAGRRVDIRPVRVQPMFDGGTNGPMLSDHQALRVTYDLSWPVDTPAAGACRAAPLRS